MDIIFLLYIVLILTSVRIAKFGTQFDDYMSLDNTGCLRGVMAIGIMLHHISEHTLQSNYLFHFMRHFGYLFVAVFFLLSGFGLVKSYQKKKKKYLDSFWRSRVLYLLALLVLNKFFYAILDLISKKTAIGDLLKSIITGNWAAGSAWYLIALVLFYICFWLIYSFSCSKKRIVLLSIFAVAAVDLLFALWGKTDFWIYSNFAFAIGIIWAECEEEINNFLLKQYFSAIAITAFLFLLFSFIPALIEESYTACRMISAPLFSILCMLLLRKVHFVGSLWKKVNGISLEIYLIHAGIYSILRSDLVRISNDIVWAAATIIITITLSIFARKLNQGVRRLLNEK